MWEKKDVKKANLSVLDISSAIIARVEAMPENVDYFYIGEYGRLPVGGVREWTIVALIPVVGYRGADVRGIGDITVRVPADGLVVRWHQ